MRRTILFATVVSFLLFGFSEILFASAAGELRERSEALRKEASAIADRGSNELSARLESESAWLLGAAERQGDRPDIVAAGELRERAKALRKEASVISERRSNELSRRLESESVWLLEAAARLESKAKGRGEKKNRPGINKEVQQLQERLQDLLAEQREIQKVTAPGPMLAKVQEQISATARELRQIQARHAEQGAHRPEYQAQAEKLAVAGRRILHLQVAAENLKLAGEQDLAHKIMEKAQLQEREVEDVKHRLAVETHQGREHQRVHGPEVVRDLQAEIERLRAEVKELSQKNEKR